MLTGYKTIIFNAIMGIVFIAQAALPDSVLPQADEVNSFLDAVLSQLDLLVTVVGNVWLRFKTTTPVFQKR